MSSLLVIDMESLYDVDTNDSEVIVMRPYEESAQVGLKREVNAEFKKEVS